MLFEKNLQVKPFLKWAGGKTQLISHIAKRLPDIVNSNSFTFIEPFVGSGAVLFWMLGNFKNIEVAIINDANKDLINLYRILKKDPYSLINLLNELESEFLSFEHKSEKRKSFYYQIRDAFNDENTPVDVKSAYFIFLNKTCFNGLFRVNSKNKFNVPMGDYKSPSILNKDNLLSVSEALQKVEILSGDYTQILPYCNPTTFIYFDPPYKPISETSSFNSYGKDIFDDAEQIRLKEFCDTLDDIDSKFMLSNSDVNTSENADMFFDILYAEYNIQRVYAKRNINSKSASRGQITEILVTNY